MTWWLSAIVVGAVVYLCVRRLVRRRTYFDRSL